MGAVNDVFENTDALLFCKCSEITADACGIDKLNRFNFFNKINIFLAMYKNLYTNKSQMLWVVSTLKQTSIANKCFINLTHSRT